MYECVILFFYFRSFSFPTSSSENYNLENNYDDNSQRRTFGSLFSSKSEPSYNTIKSDVPPIDKNSFKWFKVFKKKRKKRIYNHQNKRRGCSPYRSHHIERKSDNNYANNQFVAAKYYPTYYYRDDYFPVTEVHNKAQYLMRLKAPRNYYDQQNLHYGTNLRPHIMRIPWQLPQPIPYPHIMPVRKVKRKLIPWNYSATWRVAPPGKIPYTYRLKEPVPGNIAEIPPYSPKVNNHVYAPRPVLQQDLLVDPIYSASSFNNNHYTKIKKNNFNENTWKPSSPLPQNSISLNNDHNAQNFLQPETKNNTGTLAVSTPSSIQRVIAGTDVKYETVTPVSTWVAINLNQTINRNQNKKINTNSNITKEKRVRKNVKNSNQESKSVSLNGDSTKPDIVTAVYPFVIEKNDHDTVQNFMQKNKFVVFSNKNKENKVVNFQIVKNDLVRNENKN